MKLCPGKKNKEGYQDGEEYKENKRYKNGVERYFNEMNIIKILK
jgi:hypothetical protein